MSLGRGRFSKVLESGDVNAVKIIDVDDQKRPHNYKVEIAALEKLQNCDNVVKLINIEMNLKSMDPVVKIYMPKLNYTLEHVIYHFAKASYPPGSGWRNVMPNEVITRIMLGLSRALNACHKIGIIHRDVKPDNIMFSSFESEPVLIDFGVSFVPNVGIEKGNDMEVDVCTGEYKAPELLYGIRAYTNKIDIWSLGCILQRLRSTDCKPIFAPYLSDIQLITEQFKLLGRPKISDCPSFKNTAAESILGLESQPGVLNQNVNSLLSFEPTKRPSAEELVLQYS